MLPESVKKLGENPFLDSYVMEFLNLPNEFHENDLRKALIKNMKDFILELGKDFTFIDEEYKVQVGGDDFRIDLLFYHRGLQCLVAIELKIGKFKPEYISKLDFYLEALDRQVKKENENPSVGLLLCAAKNDEVVEYAMSRTMSPMLVSQYQLQLPDDAEKAVWQLTNPHNQCPQRRFCNSSCYFLLRPSSGISSNFLCTHPYGWPFSLIPLTVHTAKCFLMLSYPTPPVTMSFLDISSIFLHIFIQTGSLNKISCTFHYFSPAQIYSSCSPFSTSKCIIVVY